MDSLGNSLSICMCEHAGSVSRTNVMYSFCSGQWCCCSFSLPAEVVLHTALPQNSTFFLLFNQKSSPRNRRLILDSCMQFKTILHFNASALFLAHLQKEQLYTWAPMGQNEIRTPGRLQTMWPLSPSPTAAQVRVCEQISFYMPKEGTELSLLPFL